MSIPTNSDARMTKGLELSKNGTIRENEDGSFTVPSQTSEGVSYEVRLIADTWVCDCPDFLNRSDRILMCKHAHAVKFWLAANTYLKNEPKPKVFSDDAIQCDRCGSIRVIQFGRRAGKQVYYCNDCKHKFTPSLLKNDNDIGAVVYFLKHAPWEIPDFDTKEYRSALLELHERITREGRYKVTTSRFYIEAVKPV